MDKITKEQRSKIMRAVKATGSEIEILLMKAIWAKGCRYKKHDKKVFGKPDIAFKGLKIAVFCDSEFWHGKDWDIRKKDIKTNQDFWCKKIERNIVRDKEVTEKLQNEGWAVLRFWGKDIEHDIKICIQLVEKTIENKRKILLHKKK